MFYKNYNLEEWYKERIMYIKLNKKIYVPLCFFSLFLYLIILYFNTKLNQSTQLGLKVYNKNWWDGYVLSNFFLTIWYVPTCLIVLVVLKNISLILLKKSVSARIVDFFISVSIVIFNSFVPLMFVNAYFLTYYF